MAKRGTLEHPKTLDLADRLGLEPWMALGLLEALWHWTAKYAPTGDITKYRPCLIAKGIRYSGDAEELFAALRESRFIDCENGSIIVHDWADHADETTRKNLRNRGEEFANHSRTIREPFANHSRLPEPEPMPMPEPMPKPEGPPLYPPRAFSADAVETSLNGAGAPANGVFDASRAWEEFITQYPRRSGALDKAVGRNVYAALMRRARDPCALHAEVMAGLRRYAEWCSATGKTGTELVKQIPPWLRAKRWAEDYEELPVRSAFDKYLDEGGEKP